MRGNTISIKGNVTRDAEVRAIGRSNVVSWAICWNSRRKADSGEYEDVPHYIDCKCWATDAQLRLVEGKLVKGAACAIVDGHVEQERWEDRSGNKRSRVVIMVDDPIGGMIVQPRGDARPKADIQPIYDEDIPF